MRVGVFKRIGSFLLDAIPLFFILSLLFTFLVGDLLKPNNYDALMSELEVIQERYNDLIEPYKTQYEDDIITEAEYTVYVDDIRNDYLDETSEHLEANLSYIIRTVIYYVVAFILTYYIYNVVTKGNTIGRQMMKIELQGKINWWTLLLREVFWKPVYWVLTLGIGGIILDIAMITFSNRKQAPRDIVSGITVQHQGVNYPF